MISAILDFISKWGTLIVATMALFMSTLNALKPKLDSEYNICLTLVRKSKELWSEYNCSPPENGDSEKFIIKILDHTEWSFIYINERHNFFKSGPLKHLEQEIIEPFERCLSHEGPAATYLRQIINKHTTSEKTFSALKKALKRKKIKL